MNTSTAYAITKIEEVATHTHTLQAILHRDLKHRPDFDAFELEVTYIQNRLEEMRKRIQRP